MKTALIVVLSLLILLLSIKDTMRVESCVYAARVVKVVNSNIDQYDSARDYYKAMEPHVNYIKENCSAEDLKS